MKLHTIASVVVAVLVVGAGAAIAAPGQAPDDAGADASEHSNASESDHAADAPNASETGENESSDGMTSQDDAASTAGDDAGTDDNASTTGEDASAAGGDMGDVTSANASDTGETNASEGQGPDATLPEQVPDHVSQVHDLINQFLSGDLGGTLGDAVSGVTPDDDESSSSA